MKYLAIILLLAGCRGKPPKPDWKLWAGDSDKAGITRAQDNLTISCAEVKMDDYVCMSYSDFGRNMQNILSSCDKWHPGGTLTVKEISKDPLLVKAVEAMGGNHADTK